MCWLVGSENCMMKRQDVQLLINRTIAALQKEQTIVYQLSTSFITSKTGLQGLGIKESYFKSGNQFCGHPPPLGSPVSSTVVQCPQVNLLPFKKMKLVLFWIVIVAVIATTGNYKFTAIVCCTVYFCCFCFYSSLGQVQ